MPGGLIQLLTAGSEDIPLIGNPEVTFFKTVYRQYNNFSIEQVTKYIGQKNFNTENSFKIDKVVDLLGDLQFVIDIPQFSLNVKKQKTITTTDKINVNELSVIYSDITTYLLYSSIDDMYVLVPKTFFNLSSNDNMYNIITGNILQANLLDSSYISIQDYGYNIKIMVLNESQLNQLIPAMRLHINAWYEKWLQLFDSNNIKYFLGMTTMLSLVTNYSSELYNILYTYYTYYNVFDVNKKYLNFSNEIENYYKLKTTKENNPIYDTDFALNWALKYNYNIETYKLNSLKYNALFYLFLLQNIYPTNDINNSKNFTFWKKYSLGVNNIVNNSVPITEYNYFLEWVNKYTLYQNTSYQSLNPLELQIYSVYSTNYSTCQNNISILFNNFKLTQKEYTWCVLKTFYDKYIDANTSHTINFSDNFNNDDLLNNKINETVSKYSTLSTDVINNVSVFNDYNEYNKYIQPVDLNLIYPYLCYMFVQNVINSNLFTNNNFLVLWRNKINIAYYFRYANNMDSFQLNNNDATTIGQTGKNVFYQLNDYQQSRNLTFYYTINLNYNLKLDNIRDDINRIICCKSFLGSVDISFNDLSNNVIVFNNYNSNVLNNIVSQKVQITDRKKFDYDISNNIITINDWNNISYNMIYVNCDNILTKIDNFYFKNNSLTIILPNTDVLNNNTMNNKLVLYKNTYSKLSPLLISNVNFNQQETTLNYINSVYDISSNIPINSSIDNNTNEITLLELLNGQTYNISLIDSSNNMSLNSFVIVPQPYELGVNVCCGNNIIDMDDDMIISITGIELKLTIDNNEYYGSSFGMIYILEQFTCVFYIAGNNITNSHYFSYTGDIKVNSIEPFYIIISINNINTSVIVSTKGNNITNIIKYHEYNKPYIYTNNKNIDYNDTNMTHHNFTINHTNNMSNNYSSTTNIGLNMKYNKNVPSSSIDCKMGIMTATINNDNYGTTNMSYNHMSIYYDVSGHLVYEDIINGVNGDISGDISTILYNTYYTPDNTTNYIGVPPYNITLPQQYQVYYEHNFDTSSNTQSMFISNDISGNINEKYIYSPFIFNANIGFVQSKLSITNVIFTNECVKVVFNNNFDISNQLIFSPSSIDISSYYIGSNNIYNEIDVYNLTYNTLYTIDYTYNNQSNTFVILPNTDNNIISISKGDTDIQLSGMTLVNICSDMLYIHIYKNNTLDISYSNIININIIFDVNNNETHMFFNDSINNVKIDLSGNINIKSITEPCFLFEIFDYTLSTNVYICNTPSISSLSLSTNTLISVMDYNSFTNPQYFINKTTNITPSLYGFTIYDNNIFNNNTTISNIVLNSTYTNTIESINNINIDMGILDFGFDSANNAYIHISIINTNDISNYDYNITIANIQLNDDGIIITDTLSNIISFTNISNSDTLNIINTVYPDGSIINTGTLLIVPDPPVILGKSCDISSLTIDYSIYNYNSNNNNILTDTSFNLELMNVNDNSIVDVSYNNYMDYTITNLSYTTQRVILNNLLQNRMYNIAIIANNTIGMSSINKQPYYTAGRNEIVPPKIIDTIQSNIDSSVYLSWTPSEYNNNNNIVYKVIESPTEFYTDNAISRTFSDISSTFYNVTDVKYGVEFTYIVVAMVDNKEQSSQPSTTIKIVNKPTTPTNIRITPIFQGITVSWDLPLNIGDSSISYYKIYVTNLQYNMGGFVLYNTTNNFTSYTINNLLNDNFYSICICAVNSVYDSDLSLPLVINTNKFIDLSLINNLLVPVVSFPDISNSTFDISEEILFDNSVSINKFNDMNMFVLDNTTNYDNSRINILYKNNSIKQYTFKITNIFTPLPLYTMNTLDYIVNDINYGKIDIDVIDFSLINKITLINYNTFPQPPNLNSIYENNYEYELNSYFYQEPLIISSYDTTNNINSYPLYYFYNFPTSSYTTNITLNDNNINIIKDISSGGFYNGVPIVSDYDNNTSNIFINDLLSQINNIFDKTFLQDPNYSSIISLLEQTNTLYENLILDNISLLQTYGNTINQVINNSKILNYINITNYNSYEFYSTNNMISYSPIVPYYYNIVFDSSGMIGNNMFNISNFTILTQIKSIYDSSQKISNTLTDYLNTVPPTLLNQINYIATYENLYNIYNVIEYTESLNYKYKLENTINSNIYNISDFVLSPLYSINSFDNNTTFYINDNIVSVTIDSSGKYILSGENISEIKDESYYDSHIYYKKKTDLYEDKFNYVGIVHFQNYDFTFDVDNTDVSQDDLIILDNNSIENVVSFVEDNNIYYSSYKINEYNAINSSMISFLDKPLYVYKVILQLVYSVSIYNYNILILNNKFYKMECMDSVNNIYILTGENIIDSTIDINISKYITLGNVDNNNINDTNLNNFIPLASCVISKFKILNKVYSYVYKSLSITDTDDYMTQNNNGYIYVNSIISLNFVYYNISEITNMSSFVLYTIVSKKLLPPFRKTKGNIVSSIDNKDFILNNLNDDYYYKLNEDIIKGVNLKKYNKS